MTLGTANTGPTIVGGTGTAIALNTRFRSTYDLTMEYWKPLLAMLMDEVPTDRRVESYFYRESRPYPTRWADGVTRGTKGFKTVRWNTVTKDWTDGVSWDHNNLKNDVTRTLEGDVKETASRWGTLRMRVRAQMLEATTDADLLDTIPNAPDGVGLFSATNGAGGDRFGVSGGNIKTGSGVSNEAQVQRDYYGSLTRWQRMLDTENQPLIDPGVFAQGIVVEYPPELEEVMARSFKQAVGIQTIKATGATAGATSNVAVAGVTNVVLDSGQRVVRFCNPWLSDTLDWYIHLVGANVKSTYVQVMSGLAERILTMDTGSETAIKSRLESVFWDKSEGFGANLPYSSIKVNNS